MGWTRASREHVRRRQARLQDLIDPPPALPLSINQSRERAGWSRTIPVNIKTRAVVMAIGVNGSPTRDPFA